MGSLEAAGRDQVWAGDLTCVPSAEGWLDAAVVLDRWNRRVIGWACASNPGGDATRAQATADFFASVETYRSRVRRHRALGYQSPADFEIQLNQTNQHHPAASKPSIKPGQVQLSFPWKLMPRNPGLEDTTPLALGSTFNHTRSRARRLLRQSC